MSRWLAGVFDPSGRVEASRLADALSPHTTRTLDSASLAVAYSGPESRATAPLCLLDGHLDNAEEIAIELESSPPSSSSSEELLAAAYRRWGRGLPSRMRGDFVLLVWDHERDEGFLARDQLGVRPVFLHDSGGVMRFASEIRHLLRLLPRLPQPDPASLAHWIAASSRPGTQTLYAGVRRLRPGGMLLLSRRGAREERYWSPRFEEPLDLAPEQLAARVRDGLERAVSRRRGANGSTGVLMSGGLDSSAIAALCAEDPESRTFACAATFPDHPATDESELIAELRQALALPGLTAEVRPGGLLVGMLEHLATWRMPQLGWGDFWMVPLMQAAAAEGVEGMLDGDGGDELFGPRSYLLADCVRAGHPMRALALAGELPGAGSGVPRRTVARVVGSLALGGSIPYRLHSAVGARLASREAPGWMRRRTVRDLAESDDPFAWKRLDGPRWWAHAAHGLASGIEEAGVFEHQRRRAALTNLEVRHPMLDLDLVELGLRQPPRATLDRRFNRPVLRNSMTGLLPDAVRLRPKKAWFESLIVDCLSGSDGAIVRRLLTEPGAELGAYVELGDMRRALFDTDPSRRSDPFRWMWQVWRLLTAECWLRAQALPVDQLLPPDSTPSATQIEIRPVSEPYVFPP